MKASFKLKAAAGLLALATTGSAFANTALDTTNGSFVLTIWDTVTNTSYVFDTGLTQASFNGNTSSFSTTLSDANYNSFISASGSDFLEYNVYSAKNGSGTPVFSTASGIAGAASQTSINSATGKITGYFNGVNALTSGLTTSALVASSDSVNFHDVEAGISALTTANDVAQVGTAMALYSWIGGRSSSAAAMTTYTGSWDLVGNVLSYTQPVVAAVPVPTSWLLLLSGLGLMGVIARRGKTTSGDNFSGFAA